MGGCRALVVAVRAKGRGKQGKQDECEYIEVSEDGSDSWRLDTAVDLLQRGGVGVIPTDTMYALVCDINNATAVDALYRIKDMNRKKPLSILCRDFSDVDLYTRGFPMTGSMGNASPFRLAKQCLPGAYTLILPASKSVPKRCFKKLSGATTCRLRREVGVRIPDDPICAALLARSPNALLATSVRANEVGDEARRLLEPSRMLSEYAPRGLAFVVDGGPRPAEVSTVIDLTSGDPVILRTGKGDPSIWGAMDDDQEESTLLNAYQFPDFEAA